MGRSSHFLLCSSSSVFLPGNNNIEIPASFSQESLYSGKERRNCELLHIKPRSICLRLPSPYLSPSPSSCLQQQVQRASTDPQSNNPRGTCSAFSEITASEKNYLLRAAVGSTNTFSSPQQLGYRRRRHRGIFLKLYLTQELM